MKFLAFALILATGRSIAPPGVHQDAIDDSPDMTPPSGQCGNGNMVCAPDQVCFNGDCLTLCGSPSCWMQMQAAWGMCGG